MRTSLVLPREHRRGTWPKTWLDHQTAIWHLCSLQGEKHQVTWSAVVGVQGPSLWRTEHTQCPLSHGLKHGHYTSTQRKLHQVGGYNVNQLWTPPFLDGATPEATVCMVRARSVPQNLQACLPFDWHWGSCQAVKWKRQQMTEPPQNSPRTGVRVQWPQCGPGDRAEEFYQRLM